MSTTAPAEGGGGLPSHDNQVASSPSALPHGPQGHDYDATWPAAESDDPSSSLLERGGAVHDNDDDDGDDDGLHGQSALVRWQRRVTRFASSIQLPFGRRTSAHVREANAHGTREHGPVTPADEEDEDDDVNGPPKPGGNLLRRYVGRRTCFAGVLLLLLLGIILVFVTLQQYVSALSSPSAEVRSAMFQRAVTLKGPDGVQVLRVDDDGVLLRLEGRVKVDVDAALDVWLGGNGFKRRIVGWGVKKVKGVRIELGDVFVMPQPQLADDPLPALVSSVSDAQETPSKADDGVRARPPPIALLAAHVDPVVVPLSTPDLHRLNLTLLARPVAPARTLSDYAMSAYEARVLRLHVSVSSLHIEGMSDEDMRNDGTETGGTTGRKPSEQKHWWDLTRLVDVTERDVLVPVEKKIPVDNSKNRTGSDIVHLSHYEFFQLEHSSPSFSSDDQITPHEDPAPVLGIRALATAPNPLPFLRASLPFRFPFGIWLPVPKEEGTGAVATEKLLPFKEEDKVLMALVRTQPVILDGGANITLRLEGRVLPPDAARAQLSAFSNDYGKEGASPVLDTALDTAQLVFASVPAALPSSALGNADSFSTSTKPDAHQHPAVSAASRSPADAALSSFLSRFLRGQANRVYVRGGGRGTRPEMPPKLPARPEDQARTEPTPSWMDEMLSEVELAVSFPGTSRTELLKDIVIEDMKITPHPLEEDKLLCSGTIVGELNLPDELQSIKVDITAIWPDILVYNGYPPSMRPKSSRKLLLPSMRTNDDGDDDLPHPIPPNAFARLRPSNYVPATTLRPADRPGVTLMRAELKDIPFNVLAGRGPVFRRFAGKVLFGSDGALAGVEGKAKVLIQNDGLGELGLRGLPVKGAFKVGGRKGESVEEE